MQLGMIGLGRMGANIVRRLMRDGHACVVYDANPKAAEALASEGAVAVKSLAELKERLRAPRAACARRSPRPVSTSPRSRSTDGRSSRPSTPWARAAR